MTPKLILKSLAASMPGRAVNASKQVLGPAVRETRREFRAARRNSAAFARDIFARASARFQPITPWQRGGINE